MGIAAGQLEQLQHTGLLRERGNEPSIAEGRVFVPLATAQSVKRRAASTSALRMQTDLDQDGSTPCVLGPVNTSAHI